MAKLFEEKNRLLRMGVIGLGWRGFDQTLTLMEMKDVEIVAVCDQYPDRVEDFQRYAREKMGKEVAGTTDYRELNAREDIEAVMVVTGWTSHIRIAVDALEKGKAVAMEVGGASSIDECWKLVRTAEATGLPVMMLENANYDPPLMAALNMVRQGVFGELVHLQGGYQHDLRSEIGYGDVNRHYRQQNFLKRNGDLYPTHDLGPLAKMLDINRGNRMISLCSMTSKAVGLRDYLKRERPQDEISRKAFRQGDVTTTMIRCAGGETILLIHDCTLPRPYSDGFRVQGSKGLWMKDMAKIHIEGQSPAEEWSEDADYMQRYQHPLWKAYERFGPRGGHDGLDYLTLRAFVESIQNRVQPPIDVYDTASWMAITCLSEQSIALGGAAVDIPDFTDGEWILRGREQASPYALDDVHIQCFEQ